MIVIHLELRERRAQNLHLRFGRRDTRPQTMLGHVGIDDSRKRAQDDEHEQHFDKGKSPVGSMVKVVISFWMVHSWI
jgi:hypothetical protein